MTFEESLKVMEVVRGRRGPFTFLFMG